MTWRDPKRPYWLLGLVVPILPFLAWAHVYATGQGIHWWLGPLTVFGLVPFVDHAIGKDTSNPPEAAVGGLEADRYYRWCVYLFLYHLQRHSDHHANPTRRYQALRHFSGLPELPSGYAGIILLAYIPPLWRRAMDPRVVAHYGGDVARANIHPRARAGILARYADGGLRASR